MELTREYSFIKLSGQRIKEVFDHWEAIHTNFDGPARDSRVISMDTESWRYDSDVEFLSAYHEPHSYSLFEKTYYLKRKEGEPLFTAGLKIKYHLDVTEIQIKDVDRHAILEVKNFIENDIESFTLPKPEKKIDEKPIIKPVVFIGHGGSEDWRDLKDHLLHKHDIEVVAYETGARTGHTIRDILSEMMTKTSFAILVMTAEDKQADGSMNARPNVIHEVGLFQGKLGFNKAIVALEKGTNLFSNMDGIQQLRFSTNNIKEIFGDVVAVINREFKM